jgi:hypothetical protein
MFQYLKMSETLQLNLLTTQEYQKSTPSLEDSRVKISAMQASKKDLRAIAAPCSLKLSDSFAHLPQGSLSWKTWQRCLDGDWTEFSGSLPKSGTMQSGALWQLPKWALATGATGSGSLHGPLLPTPTANDNDNRRTKPTPAELEGRHGWALRSAIAGIEQGVYPKLLPTPKAIDGEHPGITTHKAGQTLHLSAAVMLQIPVTSDQGVGKKLNPVFVGRMMGFPSGWTDLTAEVSDPVLMSPYDVVEALPYATDATKIPYRKERLMAYGNAVVPQCAAIALQRAKEILIERG